MSINRILREFRPIKGRIVVATHNAGKLKEFRELLKGYEVEVMSAGELGLPSPEETGVTFTENAILKAKTACLATGSIALSDDSGLCVNGLDGRPGIYSARWAEPHKDFARAMQRVHDELGAKTDRTAYFVCVLALCWPDGHVECIEGRIDGTIAKTPRGTQGHGYDPVFIPKGETRTFAEMSDAEKNAISHRGLATRELVEKFFAQNPQA